MTHHLDKAQVEFAFEKFKLSPAKNRPTPVARSPASAVQIKTAAESPHRSFELLVETV